MIACGTAEEDKWRALASSTQDVAFLDWLRLNIFDLNPKPNWRTCTDLLLSEFGNTRASNQARTDFLKMKTICPLDDETDERTKTKLLWETPFVQVCGFFGQTRAPER